MNLNDLERVFDAQKGTAWVNKTRWVHVLEHFKRGTTFDKIGINTAEELVEKISKTLKNPGLLKEGKTKKIFCYFTKMGEYYLAVIVRESGYIESVHPRQDPVCG